MPAAKTKKKVRGRIEIYRDKTREFRWRVISANGRTVANSGESYKRKQACQNGIRSAGEVLYNLEPIDVDDTTVAA